jgi:hypothetical protein
MFTTFIITFLFLVVNPVLAFLPPPFYKSIIPPKFPLKAQSPISAEVNDRIIVQPTISSIQNKLIISYVPFQSYLVSETNHSSVDFVKFLDINPAAGNISKAAKINAQLLVVNDLVAKFKTGVKVDDAVLASAQDTHFEVLFFSLFFQHSIYICIQL